MGGKVPWKSGEQCYIEELKVWDTMELKKKVYTESAAWKMVVVVRDDSLYFCPLPLHGWSSPNCMWCYLTKTLLCIFGLQPRSLGARLHSEWVCACLCVSHSQMNAGPCAHVLRLNAAPLWALVWLLVWVEWWRRRRMVASALNKPSPHVAPARLMPGTDREQAAQVWEAVFTQGRT